MTLTLFEGKLGIQVVYGNKIFNPGDNEGYTHTLKMYKVTSTDTINRESTPQGPIPTSYVLGFEPKSVRIEGSFGTIADVNTILEAQKDYRSTNKGAKNFVFNIFLCGSILTVTSNCQYSFEMPSGSKWLVDQFRPVWDAKTSNRIDFTLQLLRWYGDE